MESNLDRSLLSYEVSSDVHVLVGSRTLSLGRSSAPTFPRWMKFVRRFMNGKKIPYYTDE